MSLPITPSKQELRAAVECGEKIVHDCAVALSEGRLPRREGNELALIIAAHTRHEGKTAQELGALQYRTEQIVEHWKQRAEAAEARVKELYRVLLDKNVVDCGSLLCLGEVKAAALQQRIAELEAGK